MPGSQVSKRGYDNFVKQGVPRWTTTKRPLPPTSPRSIASVLRYPVPQARPASFGFKVAQARPDKSRR